MLAFDQVAGNPDVDISIAAVGEQFGLTAEQALLVARRLESAGYIRLHGATSAANETASLTEKGLEFVEDCLAPWHVRFLRSDFAKLIAAGVIASILTLAATKLLSLLFGW